MKNSPTNKILIFVIACFCSCSKVKKDNAPWVNIFDGNTFNGWSIKGGNATYKVEDGIIVGTTVSESPNSFLTSDKNYGDFILELDYKVDSTMNSGIQIRSNSFPYYRDGVVHGYQIEIDPSDRAWSAGIYDEQGRKWLNTLTDNSKAQKAFKQNDWNHYRIEAIGDTIKTWINEVPAAYLIDDKTATGFIGLQVHRISDDQKPGKSIMWKNIRIITDNPEKFSTKIGIEPVITKNQLTITEEANGWKMLWDGKTTTGWRSARSNKFPSNSIWQIKKGELSVITAGGLESAEGGDIVTTDLYEDFELSVDFKISSGGNSGIKYYVDTALNKGPGSSIGLEYQILDDELHPDAKLGAQEGSRAVTSLYDLIQADPNKPINPVGEWNTAYISSNNNHVEHWLNGVKVLEYERESPEFLKLVAESKYAKWPNFGRLEKGTILLQEHGNKASFKNIKIRTINKDKK